MEAMASGRPVVAADAMALPHLVHDGDNGYLFPPDDVVAFADRLKRILTADQAELDRLSENSLHLIQAHDIERTLTIFESLYRGVGEGQQTSDDNSEDYNQPIGLLPESLHQRVLALRERARAAREAARERAEDVRDEVLETLEELRDDVLEKTKEVNTKLKKSAKKTARKAKKVVKTAAEKLKGDDE
jgi:vacuolar-type H+-ATPase subunit H